MRLDRSTLVRARDVALAVVIAIGALFFIEWWDFTLPSIGAARYQAVFLANGQTYFGRYLDRIGPYVKVEHAYYIRQAPATNEDTPPDLQIVRRGSELHAPPAAMLIPKSSILFIEDLQPSSPFAEFMDRDRAR